MTDDVLSSPWLIWPFVALGIVNTVALTRSLMHEWKRCRR